MYQRRLASARWSLELEEVPTGRRGTHADGRQARAAEAAALLKRARGAAHLIALDERGQGWDSAELARRMDDWQQSFQRVALLVGGPDGLAADCLEQAAECWSLSPLTLPHGLVRVLVAEQIYRAWTLHSGHPYHRA